MTYDVKEDILQSLKVVSPLPIIINYYNYTLYSIMYYNTMWYAMIQMCLQIKTHEFSQEWTCISDVNQQIKYLNVAPLSTMISQLDYDCIVMSWACGPNNSRPRSMIQYRHVYQELWQLLWVINQMHCVLKLQKIIINNEIQIQSCKFRSNLKW